MVASIKVYLFPDTSKYIISDNNKILNEIEKDTNTHIKFYNKKYDSFFAIDGNFEDTHKARIILQDIEKNVYRDAFLDNYTKNN